MAKTRSQTGNITIKKEQDCKPSLGLINVYNTRSSGRIAKRKPSIINNRGLPAQQVKVEEDIDTKSLLKSSSESSNLPKGQQISQEQINQLIHYIVNDAMPVYKASRKVNISQCSGLIYYNLYKKDPEKKIPSPRNRHQHLLKNFTQEQVGNLIRYINDDKLTVREASKKANIPHNSGRHYYSKYLKDPNHNIPIPRWKQSYTQDQINKFIGYIINDKMSIAAASKKAKMNHSAGYLYYRKYFKEQNPDIPAPSHITVPKRSTQEQLNEVMGYIINDKMTISAASRKANVCHSTTGIHYRQYLIDNNMKVPVKKTLKPYTQDQINELIGYIVDDKMSIIAASKKANLSPSVSYRHYHLYLNNQKRNGST
jgi:hypothetical protein